MIHPPQEAMWCFLPASTKIWQDTPTPEWRENSSETSDVGVSPPLPVNQPVYANRDSMQRTREKNQSNHSAGGLIANDEPCRIILIDRTLASGEGCYSGCSSSGGSSIHGNNQEQITPKESKIGTRFAPSVVDDFTESPVVDSQLNHTSTETHSSTISIIPRQKPGHIGANHTPHESALYSQTSVIIPVQHDIPKVTRMELNGLAQNKTRPKVCIRRTTSTKLVFPNQSHLEPEPLTIPFECKSITNVLSPEDSLDSTCTLGDSELPPPQRGFKRLPILDHLCNTHQQNGENNNSRKTGSLKQPIKPKLHMNQHQVTSLVIPPSSNTYTREPKVHSTLWKYSRNDASPRSSPNGKCTFEYPRSPYSATPPPSVTMSTISPTTTTNSVTLTGPVSGRKHVSAEIRRRQEELFQHMRPSSSPVKDKSVWFGRAEAARLLEEFRLAIANGCYSSSRWGGHSPVPIVPKWFHGRMSKFNAEQTLRQDCRNGSFLVRVSSTFRGYVISWIWADRCYHQMVSVHTPAEMSSSPLGKYPSVFETTYYHLYPQTNTERFRTLTDLIHHHMVHSLMLNEKQVLLHAIGQRTWNPAQSRGTPDYAELFHPLENESCSNHIW